jgi:adenylate kinase
MKLLLIGPPGSGKGTQGQLLSERFNLLHIATGDLLRAEVEALTPIGKEVVDYLDRGELVPDDVIVDLVMPVIFDAVEKGGYVLDGFPRSVGQAKVVRQMSDDDLNATPDAVIYLDVSRDELVRRILERAKVEDRSDDTEAVISNRLQVFEEATHPLVSYYRLRGVVRTINANCSEEEVATSIIESLGDLVPN